jgi:diaminopropionate ammonia-lyase
MLSDVRPDCIALATRKFLGPLAAETSPTVRLPASSGLGLGFDVFVKDESARLGQKSFKALGGSVAGAKAIARKLDLSPADRETFAAVKAAVKPGSVTFASASDGNHGAGLAWAARELGQPCVIWLPRGASKSRVETVTGLGSECRGHGPDGLLYDETVALARATAEKEGWLLVQDTAWEGYTRVPRDIMDAYHLVAHEAIDSIEGEHGARPTHVIVQVGVGSFAAAIVEYVRERLGPDVSCVAVEPRGSACLMASIRAGRKTEVDTHDTVCVGLDCGVVSDLAWPVLSRELDATCTVGDGVAADGVRALKECAGLTSGESGAAVGVGMLRALGAERCARLLGIGPESKVLVFNTEGCTAPEITKRILDGADGEARGDEPRGDEALRDRGVEVHRTTRTTPTETGAGAAPRCSVL